MAEKEDFAAQGFGSGKSPAESAAAAAALNGTPDTNTGDAATQAAAAQAATDAAAAEAAAAASAAAAAGGAATEKPVDTNAAAAGGEAAAGADDAAKAAAAAAGGAEGAAAAVDDKTAAAAAPLTPDTVSSGFGEAPDKTPAPFDAKTILGVDMSLADIKEAVANYPELREQAAGKPAESNFFNERTQKFDEAMRNGLSEETFFNVMKLNVDDMSPTDKVVRQRMWELDISEADAKELVADEFDLSAVLGEDPLDEEKAAFDKTSRLNKIKLGAAANSADKFLRDTIVSAGTPQVAPQINQEALGKQWGEPIKEITSKFSKFRIGDGDMAFTFEPENLDSMEKDVLDSLVVGMEFSGNHEASPENLEQMADVQKMAQNLYWQSNGLKVAKSIYAWAVNLIHQSKTNPTPATPGAALQQRPLAAGEEGVQRGKTIEEVVDSGMY